MADVNGATLTPPPVAHRLLALIFFISGATALIFETLWFHQSGLALGNSIWASSLVLAGFMGGLALGNGLVGRFGERIRRPLRVYGAIEAAVGFTGVGIIFLLPALTPWLAPWLGPLLDRPLPLNAVRLGTAFVLLLFPATAMGATLPLVVKAMFRHDRRFGSVLGRLYGWNTLGAVAGVVAADSILLPSLGVRGSGWLALALNLLAAGGAYALAWSGFGESGEPAPLKTGKLPAPKRRQAWLLLAAAFLCGGILLGLEVVWFRFLQLFVLGTGLAFALMLATVLAGIALGGLLGSAWLSWRPSAVARTPAICFTSGVMVIAVYRMLDLAASPGKGSMLQSWWEVLTLALPLMLPVAVLSGVLFTLLGEALNKVLGSSVRAAGYLTLANTSGAMLGSALAGLVLLPRLGVEDAILGLAALYGVVAAIVLLARPEGQAVLAGLRRPVMVLSAGALVAGIVLFPRGMMEDTYLKYPTAYYRQAEGARVTAIREGLTETTILMDIQRFAQPLYKRLVTNAFSMSATTYPSQRYMSLFAYLPMAIEPQPRRALLISYGVGVTAGALVSQRSLERIDVVDTSRDILEMSRRIYPGAGENPLDDPRVVTHVEDGRFFLQTRTEKFDLITGEPPPPRVAGIINLYTAEYFQLMADRLTARGLATYWLPVHSLHKDEAQAITAGFCQAFPDCSLWAGAGWDWLLMGRAAAVGQAPEPQAEVADGARGLWQDDRTGPALRRLAIEGPGQMAALFMADAVTLQEWAAGVAPLSDDEPRRLRSREPQAQEVYENFRPWSDASAAASRFTTSTWVRESLPAAMQDAAAEAFTGQKALNRLMYGDDPGLPATLPAVDRMLAETGLKILPLLLLGTDPQALRAADAALLAGHDDPGITARHGLLALAQRDIPGATERLTTAWQAGDRRPSTAWALFYVLCLSGRADEGWAFAAGTGLTGEMAPAARQALAFLADRFGLPPTAPS